LISKLFPGRKEALQQEQQNIQDLLQKHAQGLKENAAANGVLSEPSEYSYAAMHTPRAKPARKRKKLTVEEPDDDMKNSDKETESKAETESQPKKAKKTKKKKKVKETDEKTIEITELQESEIEQEIVDDTHDDDDGYLRPD